MMNQMKMDKLLLLGNGGHCRSVLDSIISIGYYNHIGIIERSGYVIGEDENDIIGTDDNLFELYNNGWTEAVITIGSIGDTSIREKAYAKLKEIGFSLPIIVDPSAIVSKKTVLHEGVYVGKRAVVNTGVTIKECAIINSGSIVEHDSSIGSFSHISPGVTICGEVTIGDYSHIGAGSVIIQKISIGRRVLIGAGSVVVKNIGDQSKAYGNPCRVH